MKVNWQNYHYRQNKLANAHISNGYEYYKRQILWGKITFSVICIQFPFLWRLPPDKYWQCGSGDCLQTWHLRWAYSEGHCIMAVGVMAIETSFPVHLQYILCMQLDSYRHLNISVNSERFASSRVPVIWDDMTLISYHCKVTCRVYTGLTLPRLIDNRIQNKGYIPQVHTDICYQRIL